MKKVKKKKTLTKLIEKNYIPKRGFWEQKTNKNAKAATKKPKPN